jgi:anti-anti-sigma regulatory factor
MLRITNTGTDMEQRWTLCGALTGPWVAELRVNWENARREAHGRSCLIDLSEVTFVDQSGVELLRTMKQDGAVFVARGVDTKYILQHLHAKGKRPLRKLLAHLTDYCGHP